MIDVPRSADILGIVPLIPDAMAPAVALPIRRREIRSLDEINTRRLLAREVIKEAKQKLQGRDSAVLEYNDGRDVPQVHVLRGKNIPQAGQWAGYKLLVVTDFGNDLTGFQGSMVGFNGLRDNRIVRVTIPFVAGEEGVELGDTVEKVGSLNSQGVEQLLVEMRGREKVTLDSEYFYEKFHPEPYPLFAIQAL